MHDVHTETWYKCGNFTKSLKILSEANDLVFLIMNRPSHTSI